MREAVKPKTDVPLETSIPYSNVPLESILCTEELHRRASRPPDYEKENRALVKLVSALADSPSTILQTLAETILDITQCDSAGLSLLTEDGKTPDVCGKRFYWPAIAGMWNPHVGGGTPRNFGPCGDVLDQNRTLLFRHFERRYPYLQPVIPTAEECLLVPFHVAGEAVGTATDRTDMPIIFITGHGDVPITVQAMKGGAIEFLTKPIDDALLSAIKNAIKRSAAALDEQTELQALRDCYASLTPREREVMQLVVAGMLNKQIGLRLEISEITVKAHRGKVMQKMKADSVADLVKIAVRLGLTPARNPWKKQ